MMTMRQLRKANNRLDKTLLRENKGILLDITLYLRHSDIYDERIEEIRQDLLYMFLDAQTKGVPIQSYIGNDYKAFCDEIIENSPRKTKVEKIMEFIETIALLFAVLTCILLVMELDYKTILTSFTIPNEIYASVYYILYYVIIIPVTFYIHRTTTKYALSHKDENRNNVRAKFSFISGIICGVIVFILALLLHTSRFLVPTMYIIIGMIACVLISCILHILSKYVRQKHIQMTKTLS